jgi:hypothetical protein
MQVYIDDEYILALSFCDLSYIMMFEYESRVGVLLELFIVAGSQVHLNVSQIHEYCFASDSRVIVGRSSSQRILLKQISRFQW